MKKSLLIAALGAALMMGIFSSCTKDNGNDSGKIDTELLVGKWELAEEITEYYESGSLTDSDTDAVEPGLWFWEFKANGGFTYTYTYLGSEPADVFNGTYSVNGNQIRVLYDGDDTPGFYTIDKLTSDKLTISYPEDGGEVIIKQIFSKL